MSAAVRATGLLLVGLLACPATARAAGTVTLTVNARAVQPVAVAPAMASARTLTLPVTDAAVPGAAVVQAGGGLKLRAGAHVVTLSAPQLVLGTRSRISAMLAGKRTTILALAPAPEPRRSATEVSLAGAQATLTPSAAQAIVRALHLRRLARASFATVAADAPLAAPAPQRCRLSTTGDPAAAAARPVGALGVVAATITWHVRDSFIQYIATGEGTTASGGATSDPPTGTPPLAYAFHFPLASGWCDPASGTARIDFTGSIAFNYADHDIALTASDPELTLGGRGASLSFAMSGDGSTGRAVIETLDLTQAAAAGSDGSTVGYQVVPAAIPSGAAASVFAGYYLPDAPFGWVSISFTTA